MLTPFGTSGVSITGAKRPVPEKLPMPSSAMFVAQGSQGLFASVVFTGNAQPQEHLS